MIAWNAHSVRDKIDELMASVIHAEVDIVLLSETWLKPNQPPLKVPGFDVYRNDRELGAAGGTAILIRDNIPHTRLNIPPLGSLEATAIRVHVDGQDHVLVAAYNARVLSRGDIDIVMALGATVIVAGDFNAKHSHWN